MLLKLKREIAIKTIALIMLREASLILLGVSIHKAIRFISHSLNGNQVVAVDDSYDDDRSLRQAGYSCATKYDVFLSFRGEDTRQTFASYLYKGLRNAGIHTFMDHELKKGEQISPVLLRTIEESKISVIIFSENYASSTWCMDELVHILECKEKFGRVVIPIFYNVDPSSIRKQKGGFGNGFDVLKRRFKDNQEKLQKWRNALIQSTSLSGWDSKNTSPEFKLVEEIVKDILRKLKYKSSSHHEGLVGISCHIENIGKLLSEVRIVGIWGMGGAGKTTLAEAVCQELRAQFDAFSFIRKVNERLASIGFNELQQTCLKDILQDEDINIYDIKSNSVKSRLKQKKVLLVLDDVENSVIAEDLIKVCDWFGEGSKIIITSRDKQVLKNALAFSTYCVPGLNFDDAFHLFSLKAFKQREPSKGYMELTKSVVNYCQGNPLALVVLGCFLYGRGKEEWKSNLEKLNEAPPKDIVDVLKLSFDGLEDKQQNVFLDLAFLVKKGGYISVNLIKQIYGSSVDIEISVLREKSLISFNNHIDPIDMHNLVMKMGLKIAREQIFSSAKTPVRLWRHEDINEFFIRGQGIEAIRYLSLDLSKIRRRTALTSGDFQKMDNLIFFEVYKSDKRNPSKLTICDDLDYLCEGLKFFIWEEYPFAHVPLHFCSENLILLMLRKSNIRQLWNENQYFPNLEEIDLVGSKHLTTLPNLSHAPRIRYVDVEGCVNLNQMHSSTVLGNLKCLCVGYDGPRRINIGGSMKRTRSGLVTECNYLDLKKCSFDKVRMKVMVCGDIIYGVRLKRVKMALVEKERAELRYLLPFVSKVGFLEGPIEYGHDFSQHYDYDYDYYFLGDGFRMEVRRRGEGGGERHVVGRLTRDNMIMDDNQREMINHHHQTSTEAGEEEEEEEEELMREYYYWGGSNATLFTRVPTCITRWSLLMQLTLRESDIMIGEDSLILNSLSSLSHASCHTVLDLTLSLPIPPPAFTIPYDHHDFTIRHDGGYCMECNVDYMYVHLGFIN